MTDRRSFVAWLGSLPLAGRHRPLRAAPPIVIDATPTALYQQPDGRNNLVRVAVTGLEAPAARARVTDRRGTLVGTAGLLSTGASLAGELWVPLSRVLGAEFQIDVEVGKQRVGRRLVRLVPPRRWTLYWIASSHTDVGLTGLQEESLEVHRRNLDAALARLPTHTDFCWTAECALQVISFVENRTPRAGEALARALRDGRVGFSAVFAQLLTGLLDHETFARVFWPAGLYAREHGLGYRAAQLADVPGQVLTFPTLLAASGVPYLASGVNPERAAPPLSPADAARPEDFFREVERRWGTKLPVRRGDTGCYREDGAASTAAELGRYRAAQLVARAAELLALWDEQTEPPGAGSPDRIEQRARARRGMWRDLLLFGEHTWGSSASGSDPDGAAAVAQWRYKRRFLEDAAAAADAQV